MIDRDEPRTSLLAAYGLPRAEAKTPHPDVPGFRPYFRTRNDKRYGSMIDWIDRLRHPLRARHYGIQVAPATTPDADRSREADGKRSDPQKEGPKPLPAK